MTVDFRVPFGFSHFRNVLHSVFFHSNQAVNCWSLWRFHYLNQNVLLKKISLVCFAVATNFSDCTAEAPGLVSPRDTKRRKWKISMGLSINTANERNICLLTFFFTSNILISVSLRGQNLILNIYWFSTDKVCIHHFRVWNNLKVLILCIHENIIIKSWQMYICIKSDLHCEFTSSKGRFV